MTPTAPKFFFLRDTSFQPDFILEVPVREFEPFRPHAQNPLMIVYRTRFQQLRAYYTRPAQNAAHPNLPQVYFADDLDFQDRTSGMIEWTRVYVTLPPAWNDFESYPYEYPGYQGSTSVLGRNPFTHVVTSKLVNDYFIVGTLPTFTSNLPNYDNFAAASWTKSSVSTSANVGAIPACAGGTNAAAQVVDDGGSAPFIIRAGSIEAGNTAAHAAVFLMSQAGGPRMGRLAIVNNTTPDINANYATLDFRTGQVFAKSAADSANVAAIGDGWWRLTLDLPTPISNAALAVVMVDDNGNPSYVPSTNKGLYAWRAQIYSGTFQGATVAPTLTADSTNYPIASSDLIPFKFGTRFLYQVPWGFGSANASATQFVAGFLSDGGYGLIATSPTLTNYKAFVTTDTANTNSYSIEATDSTQSLWLGGVWQRQRRFVKAI